MSPTRNTGKAISDGLIRLEVPHFYRNIPMAGAVRSTRVNIRSIHTSKGLGADNVAIIAATFGDVAMLANDPRLAYVALTRAKKSLLPRVVREGLLPDMMGARNGPWAGFAQKYMQMFPRQSVAAAKEVALPSPASPSARAEDLMSEPCASVPVINQPLMGQVSQNFDKLDDDIPF